MDRERSKWKLGSFLGPWEKGAWAEKKNGKDMEPCRQELKGRVQKGFRNPCIWMSRMPPPVRPVLAEDSREAKWAQDVELGGTETSVNKWHPHEQLHPHKAWEPGKYF